MELDQARYFLAACEHLNFTRAAEECHISQPSLTVAIKKLEDEFGGPLFHREGKRILLTELGVRLKPFIGQMAEQAESVRQAAKDFRLLRQVPLKIGIMTTIGPMRLSGLLARFKQDHAGVEMGAIWRHFRPSSTRATSTSPSFTRRRATRPTRGRPRFTASAMS